LQRRNIGWGDLYFFYRKNDYEKARGLYKKAPAIAKDDDTIPEKPPLIEPIDSHTWKIHGLAPLETVSERLGVMLPEDDYDTFGGLVFGLLGFIPEDGSTPELEGFGLSIKVTEIKDHQLERAVVYVERIDQRNGSTSSPD
jgi:putative hemolysin